MPRRTERLAVGLKPVLAEAVEEGLEDYRRRDCIGVGRRALAAPFPPRLFRPPGALSFAGAQALIPEKNREAELIAQPASEGLGLLRLGAFLPAQAEGQANDESDDFFFIHRPSQLPDR